MQPVPASSPPMLWPLFLAPFVLLLVFCLAIGFFWRGWEATRQHRAGTAELILQAREPASSSRPPAAPVERSAQIPTPVPAPETLSAPPTPSPPPAPPVPSASSPSPIPIPLPPPAIAQSPAKPTSPPPPADAAPPNPNPLKLQGIFYRPHNPSVVINAKTLFVGDRIANATVVAITRTTATLVQSGQTNVLTLP